MQDAVADLLAFLDRSPTPYHAVAEMRAPPRERGLPAARSPPTPGSSRAGDRALLRARRGQPRRVRGGRSSRSAEAGFRWIGAHTDSPNLRLQAAPRRRRARAIASSPSSLRRRAAPHLARPRSLARRARGAARPRRRRARVLVDFERPLLRIPNLAIHLQREIATEGLKLNPQTHARAGARPRGRAAAARSCSRRSCARAGSRPRRATSDRFDLMAYDTQPAAVAGARGEFVRPSRLDNLASCHAAVSRARARRATRGPGAATRGIVLYDHEEVGSRSAQGRRRPAARRALERDRRPARRAASRRRSRARSRARCSSRPTWPTPCTRTTPTSTSPPTARRSAAGPVIKHNASQAYASDARSVGPFADAVRAGGRRRRSTS